MTMFDIAYIVAGLTLVVFELIAVYQAKRLNTPSEQKQTITRKIVNWMAKKPKTRRLIVAAGLIWLFYHFVFEYFA